MLAGICLALLAAVPAFADPSIGSKRAEAQRAQARLLELSSSLERARAQYDTASMQLARIQRNMRENRYELHVAKHNLKASQGAIAKRLSALYMNGEQTSTLEVILGASSLDDMINRLDSAKSVTSLDSEVLAQVKVFKSAVKRHGTQLAHARARQSREVAARAAAKRSLETQLAEENRLYSSLKGQIDRMVAAQHARQLQMARKAEKRLSDQRQQGQPQGDIVVGASAVTPQNDTIVAPPPTHGGVVADALSQLNTPYVWGGAAPGGFDCSGLVMWAYAQEGVSLPHSSYAQYSYGVPVSRDQLAPGDLVFFDGLGHVGIYIGGNQFVHAPHTGDVVRISSLDEAWYSATYVGARRIL